MKLTVLSAAVLFSVYSTAVVAQTPVTQTASAVAAPVEIRIVPEAAAIDVPASELLDSVRYVPLQTTKESVLGEISQLIVSDDYFIILDAGATRSVLLFNRNGTFYKRIHQYNKKPFSSLYNIYFNAVTKSITVTGHVDGEPISTFRYSHTGEQLPEMPLKNFEGMHCFPNGNMALSYGARENISLALLNATGKALATCLPHNSTKLKEEETLANDPGFFSDSDTSVFFTRPYDYNVYRLSHTGCLTTPFRFVFPLNNSLPADFLQNDAYTDKRTEMRNGKVFITKLFFQRKHTAVFELVDTDFFLLAYYTGSGMLYAVEKAAPDAASYFLPVASAMPYTSHGNAVYTSISSLALFEAAEKMTDKATWFKSLSPALQSYFEKGGKYDNPVISILYLK